MMKVISLISFTVLLLTGCKHFKGNTDVIAYAKNPDNGLKKEVVIGDMTYRFQYKPAAYILKMENLDPAALAKRKKELAGMAWFNISFKVNDYNQSPLRYKVNGQEEYTARQDYYLNQAPKDLYMIYGKDTLYVSSYWFENNQNLTPDETMIAGFKLPEGVDAPTEDMRLSFYDRVFKNGIIKTVIKAEDLEDQPDFN